MQQGKYLYAKFNNIYTLKMVGHVTYTIGTDLDNFLQNIFAEKNFENITIDLTETTGIDSTNLGLLAKITRFMIENFQRKATIISTKADINRVLDSMGFHNAFLIINSGQTNNYEMTELPHYTNSEKERAKTILEAHKTLMQLNEKNKNIFRDIVKLLEKELDQ